MLAGFERDERYPTLGDTEMWHRGGVPWWKADVMLSYKHWWSRRRHQHTVQTYGWYRHFTFIERCPCGAFRMDGGKWREG
jgi:hypothetical protein